MFILPDGERQSKRDAFMKLMTQPEWDGKMIAEPPELGGPGQEHYTRGYDVFLDVSASIFQCSHFAACRERY